MLRSAATIISPAPAVPGPPFGTVFVQSIEQNPVRPILSSLLRAVVEPDSAPASPAALQGEPVVHGHAGERCLDLRSVLVAPHPERLVEGKRLQQSASHHPRGAAIEAEAAGGVSVKILRQPPPAPSHRRRYITPWRPAVGHRERHAAPQVVTAKQNLTIFAHSLPIDVQVGTFGD